MSAGAGTKSPHLHLTLGALLREVYDAPLRRQGLWHTEGRYDLGRDLYWVMAWDTPDRTGRLLVTSIDPRVLRPLDNRAFADRVQQAIGELLVLRQMPPVDAVAGNDEMEYMA